MLHASVEMFLLLLNMKATYCDTFNIVGESMTENHFSICGI